MIRITGMNSGLDTEAIIQELASARSMKVENMKKSQTKMSWKMDAWKELNTKIYDFYTETLDSMRFKGGYNKLTSTVSDEKAASVVVGENAMMGTQSLKVVQLATNGYLMGGKIQKATTNEETGEITYSDPAKLEAKTTLADLGLNTTDEEKINFNVTVGGKTTSITFDQSASLNDIAKKFRELGLNANFDEKSQRFYIAGKETGDASNFTIEGTDERGTNALTALGINTAATGDQKAVMTEGKDAIIELNGMTFTGSSNTFEINGLVITAKQETSEPVTITTSQDSSGIYDMIREFFKKYNELVNEFDKLYNAEDASKYKPLTAEEKDAMTETEVKEWEDKIKGALFRRDDALGGLSNAVKNVMLKGVTMSDGTQMYLSQFGIETLSYFTAKDNEKNAYHILGDKEDSSVKGEKDKLNELIASDPEKVADFFSKLAQNLYAELGDRMKASEYSSAFTVYNDKELKTQYEDYKKKIEEEQEKVNKYIDNWYSKFSAMETALAKMQSKSSAITGMLGGNN